MASPLTTSRNKYHSNIKDSTVYTPECITYFIKDMIKSFTDYVLCNNEITPVVIDTCVGTGNLLKPFKELYGDKIVTIGYDIDDNPDRRYVDRFIHKSFIAEKRVMLKENEEVLFVIQNCPFNTDQRNKDWLKDNKLGKALLPELFTDKVFELYGNNTPLISIGPMGILFNQRIKSKRWRKMRECKAQITSIIPLPIDIFENVEFHSLVLIYNIEGIKPLSWISKEYIS